MIETLLCYTKEYVNSRSKMYNSFKKIGIKFLTILLQILKLLNVEFESQTNGCSVTLRPHIQYMLG
jgi:hypothetical protein